VAIAVPPGKLGHRRGLGQEGVSSHREGDPTPVGPVRWGVEDPLGLRDKEKTAAEDEDLDGDGQDRTDDEENP